jgi:hypothetical protein
VSYLIPLAKAAEALSVRLSDVAWKAEMGSTEGRIFAGFALALAESASDLKAQARIEACEPDGTMPDINIGRRAWRMTAKEERKP